MTLLRALELAAEFVALSYTGQADLPLGVPVAEIRAQRSPDGARSWYYCRLYSAPDAAAPWPTPALPDQPGRVWVSISTSEAKWRAGGDVFRFMLVDSAGNVSPPSNLVHAIAGGAPDTCWQFTRSDTFPTPLRWSLFGRAPFVARALGDSSPGQILHVELAQLEQRPRICEIFGYWCRRGDRDSCP